MSILSEKAVALFRGGFNCSQSVFAVFCEKYGLASEQALKIACGFGGGMRCGELCGAVTGGVMVIGLKHGQYISDDKEAKSRCYAETVRFTEKFRSENKSAVCRDILGCDISTKQGMERAISENLFGTICVDSVVSAVGILEEMGY